MTYLNAKGYEIEHNPSHPLATGRNVAVHRRVLYDALGPSSLACHWCGRSLSWTLPTHHPDRVEVDHLDGNKRNNDVTNLVPVDRECNVRRQNAGQPLNWDPFERVTTCAEPSCDRPRERQPRGLHSLCSAHRWRLRHFGSTRPDIPIRESRPRPAGEDLEPPKGTVAWREWWQKQECVCPADTA